jgi:hypothetical protein
VQVKSWEVYHSSRIRAPSPSAWSGASSPFGLGGAPHPPPAEHPSHDQDPTERQDQQPPTKSSHRTKMEVDIQPIAHDRRSNVEAPERPSSQSAGAQAAASTVAIHNIDAWVDHEGKEKEKVKEKKELVFIRDVKLVDLDD